MERNLPALVVLGFLALITAFLLVIPGDSWGSMGIYLILYILLTWFLFKVGIKSIDPDFPSHLFLLAVIMKLIGSIGRYWMLVDLYDGAGDASNYFHHGQFVAGYFEQFDLSILDHQFPGSQGTTNMIYMTALVYTFLPPSLSGSYFLFAGMALAGSVFYYRASRVAFPEVNPTFARLIIFFLPTFLFWPSSLGKDTWIFFCSGLIAYGMAKFFRTSKMSGLFLAGGGLLFINFVRPHTAAFMGLAIGASYFISLFQKSESSRVFQKWIIGGGMVAGLAIFVLQSGSEYLNLGEFSLQEIQTVYASYQVVSGGSSYEPPPIFSPIGAVYGVITAIFRPFPWEAHNAPARVTAMESVLWLFFFWSRRHVFLARIRTLPRDPWLIFLVAYSGIMILALVGLGNFGILVRQRSTMLPFVWLLFI